MSQNIMWRLSNMAAVFVQWHVFQSLIVILGFYICLFASLWCHVPPVGAQQGSYHLELRPSHDDVMTWKCFLYWHFVMGIHWSLLNSHHKVPEMSSYYAHFLVSLNKLMNKLLRCGWFEMPWCSYDNIVMNRWWQKWLVLTWHMYDL